VVVSDEPVLTDLEAVRMLSAAVEKANGYPPYFEALQEAVSVVTAMIGHVEAALADPAKAVVLCEEEMRKLYAEPVLVIGECVVRDRAVRA
jgi:hypothetical protein